MKSLIAIDPGQSGGIAWKESNEMILTQAMPKSMSEMIDFLRQLKTNLMHCQIEAIVERVGTYRPGNSAVAACTFARHCGQIEATLYYLGIPCIQVAPRVWQKALGELPKNKAQRKRAIKEQMQNANPHLDVTLKTADALGILKWGLNQ